MSQPRPQLLPKWLANAPILREEIYLNQEKEFPIGEGFEVSLCNIWCYLENQQWYPWSERWLVNRFKRGHMKQ